MQTITVTIPLANKPVHLRLAKKPANTHIKEEMQVFSS